MISERLYARVSAICGVIEPYTGTYLKSRIEALDRGEIAPAQFKLDMRIASGKLSEAHAELNAIRFPKFKQRYALAMFTAGIKKFEQAIALAVKAVESENSTSLWRKVDEKLAGALRASDDYVNAVIRDRTGRAGG